LKEKWLATDYQKLYGISNGLFCRQGRSKRILLDSFWSLSYFSSAIVNLSPIYGTGFPLQAEFVNFPPRNNAPAVKGSAVACCAAA